MEKKVEQNSDRIEKNHQVIEKKSDKIECQEVEVSSTQRNLKLYFVVSACFVANLTMGLVLGFSAVLLPQLENERNLSKTDASLIASMSNIGQLVTAISSIFLASFLGRQKTIVIFCTASATGFFIATLSGGETWVLILSRILQGAAVVCSIVQVYISEISPVNLRAFFGALGTVAISLGITVVYVLGSLLHWSHVSFICGQLPLISLIFMSIFCPESPSWLYVHNKKDEAIAALKWLRGERYDLSEELKALVELNAKTEVKANVGFCEILAELKRPPVLKACLLLIAMMSLMMANGATVIVFYAVNIVKGLSIEGNSYIPAILVSVFRLIGSVIGMVLLRRTCGKKNLLTVTSTIMALAVLLLGLHLHFQERLRVWSNDNVALTSYLPVVLLVIYMISFGIGPATVPWTLQGELVPVKVAPLVSGISVFSSICTLYVLTQVYPFMEESITLAGTFWLYAGISLAMALISAIFLPETKGKTSAEILAHFE